jgi:two-component system, chemotaxis family, protein-glutamate methylesterase/glutaminase
VTRTSPIRVVIADDSKLIRHLISTGLSSHGFEVVGVGEDGHQALALCDQLKPDVLSLDLAMPGLDGIGVLKALREARSPIPVVVVSAFSPAHGARAMDALEQGAVDLAAKPAAGEKLDNFITELVTKLEAAVASRPRFGGAPRPRPVVAPTRTATPTAATQSARPAQTTMGRKMLVIASSTGGPKALAELIPNLPPQLGAGAILVQHMPQGFTASLAERLDKSSAVNVREAKSGDKLDPSAILIAPGGKHLRVERDGTLLLTDEPPIGGLRPRADVSIEDAVNSFGGKVVLAVLTGMGKDGLKGAMSVKRAGGRILSEDESTCTVYGMPRAVEEAGLVDVVAPLGDLAAAIAKEMTR